MSLEQVHPVLTEWPTFTVSGVKMTTLICTHWSHLWNIQQLNKYVLVCVCVCVCVCACVRA